MKNLEKSVVLAVCVLAGQAAYGSDEDRVTQVCKNKIKSEYRVDKFRNVMAEKEGHHKWRVYGKVKTDDHKYPFNCKVKSGEVKSYAFDGPSPKRRKDDDSDVGTALAVGAGLAIVAALAVSASNDDDDRKNSNQLREKQTHLEDDCHDELSYRIRDEHDRSASVRLESARLEGHDLVGEARVKYNRHKVHQATYTCHFNSHGRLKDSSYRLY